MQRGDDDGGADSSALWVNPGDMDRRAGSTTSLSGPWWAGVMGAGFMAAGFAAVNWPKMGAIRGKLGYFQPVLGDGVELAGLFPPPSISGP